MVSNLVLSPDGHTLANGNRDGTINIWDLPSGKKRHTLSGHSDYVWRLAISSDGQTLVSGSYDQTIKAWDLSNGKELQTLSVHTDSVWGLVISPDGQTLISSSEDKTIKIWGLVSSTRLLRSSLAGDLIPAGVLGGALFLLFPVLSHVGWWGWVLLILLGSLSLLLLLDAKGTLFHHFGSSATGWSEASSALIWASVIFITIPVLSVVDWWGWVILILLGWGYFTSLTGFIATIPHQSWWKRIVISLIMAGILAAMLFFIIPRLSSISKWSTILVPLGFSCLALFLRHSQHSTGLSKIYSGGSWAFALLSVLPALSDVGWWRWIILGILGFGCFESLLAANKEFRKSKSIFRWICRMISLLIWFVVLDSVFPILFQAWWGWIILGVLGPFGLFSVDAVSRHPEEEDTPPVQLSLLDEEQKDQ